MSEKGGPARGSGVGTAGGGRGGRRTKRGGGKVEKRRRLCVDAGKLRHLYPKQSLRREKGGEGEAASGFGGRGGRGPFLAVKTSLRVARPSLPSSLFYSR